MHALYICKCDNYCTDNYPQRIKVELSKEEEIQKNCSD